MTMRTDLDVARRRVSELQRERDALAVAVIDGGPYVRMWVNKGLAGELQVDYYRPRAATGGYVVIIDGEWAPGPRGIRWAGFHGDAIDYLEALGKWSADGDQHEYALSCRAVAQNLRAVHIQAYAEAKS